MLYIKLVQKNVDPVITETETHTITVQQQEIPSEPEHNATIVVDEPVQHSAIEDVSDGQQNMGADSSMIKGNIMQQLEDTVRNISHPLAVKEPIITPVDPLDVNSIQANPDATVDPPLQKEI